MARSTRKSLALAAALAAAALAAAALAAAALAAAALAAVALAAALAAVALAAVAPSAHAHAFTCPTGGSCQADTMSLTVNPGALSLSAPTTLALGSVTLNGAAQTVSSALGNMTVSDSRGTGVGWGLSVQAADLAATVGASTRYIPFTNLTLAGQAPVFNDNSSSPLATLTAATNALAGTDTTPGTSLGTAAFLAGAANGGMGSYKENPQVQLTVPASTYAAAGGVTYSTTLNFVLQ